MTLERLKELEATRGRADGEDLAHWADRSKHENLWVRDVALPLLIEVAEAALELYGCDVAGIISSYDSGGCWDAQGDFVKLAKRLDAALAKLEVEK